MTTDKDIGNTLASDLTNAMTPFSVDPKKTDGPTDIDDQGWMNTDWENWLGYYDGIPEAGIVIDAKATWTVGKGFTADPETTVICL